MCGRKGPESKEHVIGRWASRALETDSHQVVSRHEGQFIRQDTGLQITLKGVCAACNSGWMSHLERTVGPWLTPAVLGEQIALATPQQRIVAFWATKTALLYELAVRKVRGPMPFPPRALVWLYSHRAERRPPPGTQIWLGRADPQHDHDPERATISSSISSSLRGGPDTADDTGVHYLMTFRVGWLLVQVSGQDFSESGGGIRGRGLSFVQPPAEIEPFQVQIWPDPPPVVIWPPASSLLNSDVATFAAWAQHLSCFLIRDAGGERAVFADSALSAGRARFGWSKVTT